MIRPATLADLPALTALEQELFGIDAWGEELVRQEIEGPGRRFLVTEDLSGYAVTMTAGDIVDLLRIGVRPDARRTGIASRLMSMAGLSPNPRLGGETSPFEAARKGPWG